ncbi:MAG TPA: DUF1697 domain-containing protein [Bacteroidia bacterium]|nr:DUF1697 domain-containing protein [Bacteroidia bacterium]
MTTYISLLRGINVSGYNIIKMDHLKKMMNSLGFEHVKTYIQSGNIIYQSKQNDISKLSENIKNEILKVFGFDVQVQTLTMDSLEKVIFNNPYAKPPFNLALLHVTFLSAIPTPEKIDFLKTVEIKNDSFEIIEQSMYLYCRNGYGNSKLTNTFIENKLKVGTTTRNWKTCNELFNIAKKVNE